MAKDIRVTLELDNQKFNSQLNRSEQNVRGFEKTSTNSFAKSAIAAAGFATALAGVRQGLNISANFQDLQSSLATVFGGLEQGADAFDRVTDIASQTQFQVEDITKAFIQLKGAGVEPTKDIIMTFANAAAITTDQLGAFQAAISLISRTTAGGLGLEELERLGDRGIPVYDILNKKLGITRLQISEVGKTARGAEKIIAALGEGINERFGSALENRLQNTNQRISNFNDALAILVDSILADANVGFGELISNLTEVLKNLNENIDRVTKFTDAMLKLGAALAAVFLGGKLVSGTRNLVNSIGAFSAGSLKTNKAVNGLVVGLTALGRQFGIIEIAGKSKLTTLTRLLLGVGATSGGLLGVAGALFAVASAFSALNAVFGGEGPSVFEKQKKEIERAERAVERLEIRLNSATETLKNQIKVGDRGSLGGGMSYIENAQKQVDRLTKELQDSKVALEKLQEQYKKDVGIVGPPLPEGFVRTGNQPEVEDTITVFDKLEEAVKGVNENFRSVKQFKIYIEQLRELKKEVSSNEEWQAYEKAIKNVEDAFGMTVEEVFEPALTRIQELREEIGKVENFEDFDAVLAAIGQSLRDGDINLTEYNEALQLLKGSLDETETDMAIFQNAIKDIDSAIANDLTNALFEGENAIESLKSTFKEAIKQMIADTIRLMVVQTALQSIFGFFGYSATFAPSGGISNIVKKKQFGGPVMKNKPYIVGEDGPEMFVPNNNGAIIPNNRMGGGSTSVTYNIQAVDAPSFQALIARDPDFIHAVASKGANNLPSGRRF